MVDGGLMTMLHIHDVNRLPLWSVERLVPFRAGADQSRRSGLPATTGELSTHELRDPYLTCEVFDRWAPELQRCPLVGKRPVEAALR